VAGSGAVLLAFDAFHLKHDPQRGRDLGHILLSFGGALEQPASWRQVNLERYSAGKCFSTSARTSASVSSVSTSGMIRGRGKGRDQSGRGTAGSHATLPDTA